MFGDSFFTAMLTLASLFDGIGFSSPCMGILFSLIWRLDLRLFLKDSFRPHVWGFFFSREKENPLQDTGKFSSPCMGILFSQVNDFWGLKDMVWSFSSPCMGILFSRGHNAGDTYEAFIVFSSPCMGILFSQEFAFDGGKLKFDGFSSPCMGILFSRVGFPTYSRWLTMFSSPCMGILFSQQAWDAPRGGLSMALLRRGFPIDWISHYFHPLTFCFLRFHAHRRGFSK